MTWEPLSSCLYKDGTVASCWKDKDDPPQSTRKRKCIPEHSIDDVFEDCNIERRTCTDLRDCPMGG